jgi:hypothetical protein
METVMEGTYKDGIVELDETPTDWPLPGRVQVIYQPGESVGSRTAEPSPEEREAAIKRMIETMRKGFGLCGPPYPKRAELYHRVGRLTGDG